MKGGEIAHAIDEKLCVLDAVVLFEFRKECFSRVTHFDASSVRRLPAE